MRHSHRLSHSLFKSRIRHLVLYYCRFEGASLPRVFTAVSVPRRTTRLRRAAAWLCHLRHRSTALQERMYEYSISCSIPRQHSEFHHPPRHPQSQIPHSSNISVHVTRQGRGVSCSVGVASTLILKPLPSFLRFTISAVLPTSLQ